MKKLKNLSIAICLSLPLLQGCTKDIVPNPGTLNHAQSTIFGENFDEALNLPSGWAAPGDSGWVSDSSNSSVGYAGASGKNNMNISNLVGGGGTFTLTSKSISTTNYTDITVTYGARKTKHFADNGSAITGFACSTDGGATWIALQYTENPGDSNWYLVNSSIRIPLPASAANQASVMFRWIATLKATASGTYRIDDFQVLGTSM